MTLTEKLSEIEARAENVGKWRSDDFGHSVQRLMEAECSALCEFIEVNIKLLSALRRAVEQRDLVREWYVEELSHMRPAERHRKLEEDTNDDNSDLLKLLEGKEGG